MTLSKGATIAPGPGIAGPAGRFAAFSFVDRIGDLVPGVRAAGSFWIPDTITGLPQPLAAEAIGQLAAWAAMAQLDFRARPVAGLAQETIFRSLCAPGQTLTLEVEIESCSEEAIAYSGSARVGERPILELRHAVGPMMPMQDFDDPALVRADFETLRGAGRPPGRFAGIDAPLGEASRHVTGQSIDAHLAVPANAALFADHFPRRPVFPATLLLHALSHWAVELARDRANADCAPVLASVSNVKVRTWTLPGQTLDLHVEALAADGSSLPMRLAARSGERTVATARATVDLRGRPA